MVPALPWDVWFFNLCSNDKPVYSSVTSYIPPFPFAPSPCPADSPLPPLPHLSLPPNSPAFLICLHSLPPMKTPVGSFCSALFHIHLPYPSSGSSNLKHTSNTHKLHGQIFEERFSHSGWAHRAELVGRERKRMNVCLGTQLALSSNSDSFAYHLWDTGGVTLFICEMKTKQYKVEPDYF